MQSIRHHHTCKSQYPDIRHPLAQALWHLLKRLFRERCMCFTQTSKVMLSLEDHLFNLASSEAFAKPRDVTVTHYQDSNCFFRLWSCPRHVEVPGPVTVSEPQLQPTLLLGQCHILQGTVSSQSMNPHFHCNTSHWSEIPNHCTTVGTPEITWLHFIRYVFWVRNSMPGNCHLLVTICRGFLHIYLRDSL